jgi:hypothetical protein
MTIGESGTGKQEWKMADDCRLHVFIPDPDSRFSISSTTARVLVAQARGPA